MSSKTPLEKVEHKYTTSKDGVKLHYVVAGEGRPIFFVHGLGESFLTWRPQITFFKDKGFRVIALDLRGHGESQVPSKRVTMEGFALDVQSVLEAEGIEKAYMVGYSMGALVLLEFYKVSQTFFDKLVLEATAPEYPPAMTEILENMSMHEIAQQVAEFAVSPVASQELKREIYEIVSRTDKRVYIQSAETATEKSYRSIIQSLKVPTLFISGELDYISPPEVVEEMSRLVSNSRKVVMRGVGHMPHREKPDEYNSILLEFLTGG
ncbi:MAG: alpha/beta fold hydrolase [Infirmifilum uzonense]|uniref:alpha/beta fold hydrolase n=1 Tax=Infirmifilum uzonense TaxID=1550241 RepID=UPI002353B4FA